MRKQSLYYTYTWEVHLQYRAIARQAGLKAALHEACKRKPHGMDQDG